MNQASKLDLLMKETKKKSMGISFLNTSDVDGTDEFLENFAMYFATSHHHSILLSSESNSKNRKERLGASVLFEPMFYEMLMKKNYRQFIERIEEEEKRSDLFLHYNGRCLDANALTKSRLTQKMVILSKTSEASLNELMNFVKFIEKKKFQQPIGLILDTENKELYREHLNKLLELSNNRLNYFVEPIGYTSLWLSRVKEDEEIYQNINLRFFNQSDVHSYATYVEKCLFGG